MERKMKQRILGVMVTIGLVVILLPLFQTGEPSKVDALHKQEQEASEPAIPVNSRPDAKNDSPYRSRALAESNQPQLVPMQDSSSDSNAVRLQTDDTIQMNHPGIISDKAQDGQGVVKDEPKAQEIANEVEDETIPAKTIPAVANNAFAIDARPESLTDKIKTAELKPKAKVAAHAAKHVTKVQSSTSFNAAGLGQVQTAVWVIQLGSFKNQANAERLVSLLKASGYKAFSKRFARLGNEGVRVYVGPEPKITVANNLAGQLKEDFKLHGIVMTYTPTA